LDFDVRKVELVTSYKKVSGTKKIKKMVRGEEEPSTSFFSCFFWLILLLKNSVWVLHNWEMDGAKTLAFFIKVIVIFRRWSISEGASYYPITILQMVHDGCPMLGDSTLPPTSSGAGDYSFLYAESKPADSDLWPAVNRGRVSSTPAKG
jgi:hypothetical protein